MNCDTYLQMLETLPVDELAYGDAAHHAANCRDCDRVTRVVAERERNMLLAYGSITPPVPTGPLAAHAVELSRRRRVAFFYRVALCAAAVASVLMFVMTRRVIPAHARSNVTFVRLQCLSPGQAFDILKPSLPEDVGISSVASSSLLRIIASEKEAARIRAVLRLYDNSEMSQCGVATGATAVGTPVEARATKASRPSRP